MNIKVTCLALILQSSIITHGQSQQTANEYDFWIGDWTATWVLKDGTKIEGTNRIESTLDGKVLQEHFQDPSTNFKGTSISVFNPTTNTWHQAWADNQGGYYNFIGKTMGDKKMFETIPQKTDQSFFIQRMVFYNFTDDSMTWDWESTTNNGKDWTLNWRIEYTRKK